MNPVAIEYGLMILRWIHFFSGVTWIGLLYYFNFIQGSFFAEIDAQTKTVATAKLVPRALLYFRYAALFTFLAGVLILGLKGHQAGFGIYSTSWGLSILVGSLLGTVMFLNVWLVIWPNQKIVIASAQQVLAGGTANPEAAAAGARALLASRTNTMFSGPMLLFMGIASHFSFAIGENQTPVWATVLAIVALLELNALKGKLGPLTTVRGVIHCAAALAIVLFCVVRFLA
jgi:uncharacterized membrane protein